MKNKKIEQLNVEKIPFMPMPYNLAYSMRWWKTKSIPDVEDAGGSFNLDLYFQIMNYHLQEPDYFGIKKEETIINKKSSLINVVLNYFRK
jgi:hypothetical protein